jgi:hypothetical protein
MSNLLIPPPPVPLDGDDTPARRYRFRLWQIIVSLVTIVLCAWFFTLGVVWGIAFLFIAKHILVGVLAAGLHYPPPRPQMEQAADDPVG